MRKRYVVKWEKFDAEGKDDYGNDIEHWADPVDRKIIGIDFPDSSEPIEAGHNRLVVDRVLLVGKAFAREVGERDRITLPDEPDVTYEVQGIPADARANPFGWNPGGHIYIRRVDG